MKIYRIPDKEIQDKILAEWFKTTLKAEGEHLVYTGLNNQPLGSATSRLGLPFLTWSRLGYLATGVPGAALPGRLSDEPTCGVRRCIKHLVARSLFDKGLQIEEVLEIRWLYWYHKNTQVELGKLYGVSQPTIGAVIRRVTFTWLDRVPGEPDEYDLPNNPEPTPRGYRVDTEGPGYWAPSDEVGPGWGKAVDRWDRF